MNSVTLPLLALARANGISTNTYYSRLHRGWSPKTAAMTPPGKPFVPRQPRETLTAPRDEFARLLASIPVAVQQKKA